MWRALAAVCSILAGCGGGGERNGACSELSLADCRLVEGCKPDICPGCICDLNFRGCVEASQTPAECPVLGCPSGFCCSTQEQCGAQGQCTPPGSERACGSCNAEPGDCNTDDTCRARRQGLICEPIPCSCDGERACVDGCIADTDCDDGERCDVEAARCGPIGCARDEQCPGDFRCDGTSCVRKTCSDDRDCDGFCVIGACFSRSRGQCLVPAA